MKPGFIWGVIVGIGGVWAWHAFAKPLPGGKS